MFSCITHGWTSFERTCKECFPDYVHSSSGTAVMITPNSYVFDGNNKKIKELEEENALLKRQVQFGVDSFNAFKETNDRYQEALKHISLEDDDLPECCMKAIEKNFLVQHYHIVALDALNGK